MRYFSFDVLYNFREFAILGIPENAAQRQGRSWISTQSCTLWEVPNQNSLKLSMFIAVSRLHDTVDATVIFAIDVVTATVWWSFLIKIYNFIS